MENKNESNYLCVESPPIYWKTPASRVINNMKNWYLMMKILLFVN